MSDHRDYLFPDLQFAGQDGAPAWSPSPPSSVRKRKFATFSPEESLVGIPHLCNFKRGHQQADAPPDLFAVPWSWDLSAQTNDAPDLPRSSSSLHSALEATSSNGSAWRTPYSTSCSLFSINGTSAHSSSLTRPCFYSIPFLMDTRLVSLQLQR